MRGRSQRIQLHLNNGLEPIARRGQRASRLSDNSEVAIVDSEKMMTTIRAGGNEGSLAFFKMATETFKRSGGSRLAVWVREGRS
jgi:hypothetical protein